MNIKLYIGSELTDFNEVFNVMFSIGDVRNPSFGNSNKSYTLNIPLTRTNKKHLKFITQPDVRTEPTDIGRLYLGELLIISGKVIVQSYNDYFAKIIINSDDWIDDLKELKMISLDLSASDHALTHANVENSWAAAYPVYRYPMIDFGGLQSGEYGASAKWFPTDFIPMISIASLIAKILEPNTISSSWIATGFIKDLFILVRETIAEEDFIRDKGLEVKVTAYSDNYDTDSSDTALVIEVNKTMDFLTEVLDEGSDWSSNTYTIPATGTYRFTLSITMFNSAYGNSNLTITDEIFQINIKQAGTVRATYDAGDYLGSELIDGVVVTLDTGYINCTIGDAIIVTLMAKCWATVLSGTQSGSIYTVPLVSLFKNVWGNANRYVGLNKTISLEEMLPDMTQLDFLSAIRDIFNLRFWKDKQRNVIYIEPWDTFISTTVIDLTEFIDFEDKPADLISPNYFQNIYLRWKDDNGDKAFEEYYKNNINPVGEKQIALTSNLTKDGIDYKIHPFSTVMTGTNFTIADYANDVARIYAELPVSPYMIFNRKTGFNTRLFEWKGLTAGLTWYYDSDTKTTYPKVQGVTWSYIYSNYWQKFYHYVDKGKIYTFKLKVTPNIINQFFTVVSTAANEAFRPIYKITTGGIDNYYFMQRFTTDGYRAEIEMVLRQ